MSTISWREVNRGKHGLLVTCEDPSQPRFEIFFPSRLRLYLDLLDYLPLHISWLKSLPELDMEVAVPTPGPECPICTYPYNFKNSAEGQPAETLDGEELKETPVQLPCGHIIGINCIHYLAWSANASSCVVCPFCRVSHNHIPISPKGTDDRLAKCMWIMLEIFLRLYADDSDYEDMETVLEWARNDLLLREEVPEVEKRKAIKFAVECWVEIGDEELLRLFVARIYGPTVQCTPP